MSFIAKLAMHNVRSHHQASFDFVGTMNAIVGPNGSGKTTVIESLYTMLRGGSFRGSLLEMMKYTEDRYQIKASFNEDQSKDRNLSYSLQNDNPVKKWQVNAKNYGRLPSQLKLPVVLFEPDIARMIIGSPARRRDYLDQLAGQIDHEIAAAISKYDRVLKQRNKLLKSYNLPAESLFVWNTQLAQLGEQIMRARLKLIESLQKEINAYYKQLGGTDNVMLTYQSNVSIEPESYGSRLLQFLEASAQRDMALGFTGFGPHRDDMRILLADQPAAERASRGEVRTTVIALKMLETEILARHFKDRNIRPTLLMDDVLSELDLVHQARVLDGFKDYQVFITTTDAHTLTPGVHTIAL